MVECQLHLIVQADTAQDTGAARKQLLPAKWNIFSFYQMLRMSLQQDSIM